MSDDTYEIARDAVNIPGIGLIVAGVIGVLSFVFYGAIQGLVAVGTIDMPQAASEAEQVGQTFGLIMSFVIAAAGIGVNAFICLSGMKMRNLAGGRGGAIAASILALIPCCGCFGSLLGVPFGIWSLVVLNKAEVRDAFAGTPAVGETFD